MPPGHPIDLRPQLRDLIHAAKKRGGPTIPSALELARRWKMIPRTVNRAVSLLIAEGLLIRRGKKLHIIQSPVPGGTPQEPPFIIHTLSGGDEKWLRELFENRNCAPIFHVFSDITQCWALLEKTLKPPCEGVILAVGPDMIPPPNTIRLLKELIERRIPVVCNQPISQCNMVVSEMFNNPHFMRQLLETGHRRFLVPYSSDAQLKLLPKLSGHTGLTSVFDDFGLDAIYEPLGPAPSSKRLCEVLTRHVSGKGGATALVCFEEETAVRFCEAARSLGIKIPANLSVVLTLTTSGRTPGSQPVSAWWLSNQTGPRLAIDLAVSQIRHVRATGQLPGPETIRAEPVFIDRGTFGPAPGHRAANARPPATPEDLWQNRWPLDLVQRRQRIAAVNTAPYPAASKARADEWLPLELDGIFNRLSGHEHGWLGGLPLLHMQRGRQTIHGVPFQIASGHFSGKPDCIVMRSIHAHASLGHQLPAEVKVKIAGKAQAFYFLHGCGWTLGQKSFARYEFHYADGTLASAPLVVYKGGPTSRPAGKKRPQGNIQDWWPAPQFTQFESAHARHYVVTDGDDPFLYERYLYTLEWINPHPDKKITRLVIRSDPEAEATLGVLAITTRHFSS